MSYFNKKENGKSTALIITLLAVIVIVGFAVFSSPGHALAGNESAQQDGTAKPNLDQEGCGDSYLSLLEMSCLISRINANIGSLASWLILLVMTILEYALEINGKVLQLPAVQLGWNFTRDIANVGFVLGMIVIAFATILRNQSYGVKQLIVRLIVAAVAVNLSLSLAGVFMDLAGIPTQFFMDKITGPLATGPGGFSQTLGDAFNIQKIDAINANAKTTMNSSGRAMSLAASVFFSLIMTFVILISLMALTYMFLHRFITLAILLILMPLAILSWVFPGLRSKWSTWLGKFMQWTFFAPISMFFLYLAIYTMKAQGNYITQAANTLKGTVNGSATALEQSIMNGTNDPVLLIANMVTMVLLTMGGLFAAQSMGIAGASYGLNLATSVSKKTLSKPAGWVGGGAKAAGGAVGSYVGDRAKTWGAGYDSETKKPIDSYAQRVASGLRSIPIAGRFFSGVSENINKSVVDVQKKSAEKATRLGDQTKSYREATLRRTGKLTPQDEAAGILMAMAKKGELRDVDPEKQIAIDEKITELMGALIATNNGKEFARYMPEFAAALGQDMSKIMPTTPTETMAEMKASAFAANHNEHTGNEEVDKANAAKNKSAEDAVLFASNSGLKTISDRNPEAVGEIMKTFEKIRLNFESKNFDEADARAYINARAGKNDDTSKRELKEKTEELTRFTRIRTQREVLYADPSFSGATANQAAVESFKDERFARMGGGGAGKKKPSPSQFSNKADQTQSQ